jgi:histone H3/H4
MTKWQPEPDIPDFVVEKAARKIIKPFKCGRYFIPELNLHIHKLITQASERAIFNRRKTLRACDL